MKNTIIKGAARPTVKTWADGHGRWYAAVSSDLVDPRRAARRAIRWELAERGKLSPGYRIHVELAPSYWHELTGLPTTIHIFREVTSS